MKSARKLFLLLLIFSISICCLSGCKKSELDKNKPVTLTMWHVYGEQADSPMNRLIDEFNETVGMEKGIIINVTAMSNASKIGEKLLDAHNKMPGAAEMPDLFFAHKSNALKLGADCLLDWNEYFSEKELSAYVPGFLEDGTADGKLPVHGKTAAESGKRNYHTNRPGSGRTSASGRAGACPGLSGGA